MRNGSLSPWRKATGSNSNIEAYIRKSDLRNVQQMVATFDPETVESLMLPAQQIECPVIHTFGPGVYTRELQTPGGGTFLIGHKQRYDQLNIFIKGKVLMISPTGEAKEINAPMMFTGGAGKKVGIVLEDMIWLNVYPSDETDIDTLEETFFEKSETWKSSRRRNVIDFRNHGFSNLLSELGITQAELNRKFETVSDRVDKMPYGSYKCGVHKSPIHGRGIMATATIYQDECIGPLKKDGLKTPFEKYCNHSDAPTAIPAKVGNDIYLFATKDIVGSFGGVLGDEILIDYRTIQTLT